MPSTRFRVTIDGSWSAKEMADLFQSCDIIYRQIAKLHSQGIYNEVQRQTDDPKPQGNNDGREQVLKVMCISYSSPGWADFLGAGELAGHLKDFLIGLLDRVLERKDRAQMRQLRTTEIEAAILENYSKQLEVLDQALDFADRRDLSDVQRQQVLTAILGASRPFGKAVAEGRIVSVVPLSKSKP